jgi:DICT domain-containing protein
MRDEEAVGGFLSIRELAGRTGVPQATLRSWELRYGFPKPDRLPGGHRRYTERDVAAVEEVLRHRHAGLALEAAVRQVTSGAPRQSDSLFAELRRRHPELTVQTLTKPSLLAISRAIEDECCANAHRGVLVAAFQRERFLTASYARWVELARTADVTIVFADLPRPAPLRKRGLVEIGVPYEAALNREWVVVCDTPDEAACMVGSERPGQDGLPDDARRFETVWSADPVVVRTATQICLGLATAYRPAFGVDRWPELDHPSPAAPDLRRATNLLTRMVGYLDAAAR